MKIFSAEWLCLVFGVCTATWNFGTSDKSFKLQYSWSQLEFDFETELDRQNSINMGDFVPGKPAPIDVDVYYGRNQNQNQVFISSPRFQSGVPATLGTITNKVSAEGNPIIKPYPNWDWHRNPQNCNANRMVSVYRMMIDECDRLWVLDTGVWLNNLTCPPQILTFSLKTNKLIQKFEIPQAQIESRSILVTPIVDVRNECKDTFVYVADCQTYSIIVYDYNKETSWRVTDKTLYPWPEFGTFDIMGDSFDLMDGILGMSLEPLQPNGDRKLFYHAMSSPTENWVATSSLREQNRFASDPSSSPQIFHSYRGKRNTQSCAEAIDRNGIMYFGLMKDVEIACWSTESRDYNRDTWEVIASDRNLFQFASGMKVKTTRDGQQELWVITSRFQKVATGTLNARETNFRILVAKTDDLTFGTRCKKGGYSHGGGGPGGYGFRPSKSPYTG